MISTRRSIASNPPRWSVIFGLFLLLSSIATINVLVVSFAWEKLAAMENERNRHPSPESQGSEAQLFIPRPVVTAEDWTRTSLKCRWDDCEAAAQASKEKRWTEKDLSVCATGLVSLTEPNAPSSSIVSLSSPCVKKGKEFTKMDDPIVCTRDLNAQAFTILVDEGPLASPISVTLGDFSKVIAKDESFPIGLGVDVRVVGPSSSLAKHWDVRITSHSTEGSGRIHVEDRESKTSSCTQVQRVISVHGAAKAHLNSMYGAIRHSIAEHIQRIRTPAKFNVAVMIVWAGSKPPPSQLYDVANRFAKSDERFISFIMVEDHSSKEFLSQYDAKVDQELRPRVRVISQYDETSKGNLTQFIHTRADELVPEIKGHHQYALGWSLCDFRWMFGAIFQKVLPENEFSHWAWGDSDAFAGRLVSPISDYGHDYARHDIISYAATIIERSSPASSMMAYSSGSFTVIRNSKRGRDLFRYTPPAKLHRALIRPSNGILDEVGTSNAVMAAPNISVILIGAQARLAGTVLDESNGRLFFVSQDDSDAREMAKLARLGRVNEPFAVAPLKFAAVLARFQGGEAIPNQVRYERDISDDPAWFHPPFVNPDQFMNLVASGAGFASLIRDSKGQWWHRPLPFELFYRSRERKEGWLEEKRPIVRMEVGIVHSRLGGPCIVKALPERDFDFITAKLMNAPPEGVDFTTSKMCSPFKKFFRRG